MELQLNAQTEASSALLNPAFYARRFKPQTAWNEAERAIPTDDPMTEPEAGKWN